ncbi:hypothetical protein EZS27_010453 [termite gut metagenome]|uniref:GDP-D-glucose phosphorylase 1 n=1 Tax=termite gut metagenome TaxID=433724 RepID=A0A5J4S930_9ZZZZ
MTDQVQTLYEQQTTCWETARKNYEALRQVQVKTCMVNGYTYKVQFNPARILSSGAKVDKASIQQRACFLCAANRPAEQQGVPFGTSYTVLVNPFPIFPKHLTIPANNHSDQLIAGRLNDMLNLAQALSTYVLFYNGPKCGASAPDHIHFQAGNKGFLPIEKEMKTQPQELVTQNGSATVHNLVNDIRHTLIIESANREEILCLFNRIYNALPVPAGDQEPMMNLLCWWEANNWTLCVFPRAKHRPNCYFVEGADRLLISPASVDFGGVFILPMEADYQRITEKEIAQVLAEVCIPASDFQALKQLLKAQP